MSEEFPLTEWHKTRNERIYDFLWLRDEFDKAELIEYVYRERMLLWEYKGELYPEFLRPSTFIRNFVEYLISELIRNGIVAEDVFAGKTFYKVIAKPTKRLIDDICMYTWLKDPP